MPSKICLGEKSTPVTVSIPMPDPSLKLKIQGQGFECEPNVLTFATQAAQTFVISPTSLGQKTLTFAKMGKNARLYSKPSSTQFLSKLPAHEYTLTLCIESVGGRGGNEDLVLGFKNQEDKRKWTNLFESTKEKYRSGRAKLRHWNSPSVFHADND